MSRARIEMSGEDDGVRASEESEGGVDLLGNIDAVSVFFDHFFNRLEKPLGFADVRNKLFLVRVFHRVVLITSPLGYANDGGSQ